MVIVHGLVCTAAGSPPLEEGGPKGQVLGKSRSYQFPEWLISSFILDSVKACKITSFADIDVQCVKNSTNVHFGSVSWQRVTCIGPVHDILAIVNSLLPFITFKSIH